MRPTKREFQSIRYATAQIKQLVFLGFLALMAFIGLLWFARPKESATEQRKLTAFPKLTLAGIWDGSFFNYEPKTPEEKPGGVSTWYADTYPLRELMTTGYNAMRDAYGTGDRLTKRPTADEIPSRAV